MKEIHSQKVQQLNLNTQKLAQLDYCLLPSIMHCYMCKHPRLLH